jgi:acetyl-CoA carboxylase biotin carboxyl carrier protein
MKAKEIQDLIDFIAQSGLEEVNIETQEFKIEVKKKSSAQVQGAPQVVQTPAVQSAPTQQVVSSASTPQPEKVEVTDTGKGKLLEIKSPMIGTFYHSPNPESPAYIQEGDTVKVGQTVCIVEAMKLFNEIESEISGKIIKVLVENASPVEFDQPLFLVDPS